MDPKVTVAGAIGAGAGAVQTPLLRQFVDKKYPLTNIPSLKGFGTLSALAGMIGGGVGMAVGAVGMSRGKDGRQRLADVYVEPALDYGITALLGGILSGLYPAVTEADCLAAGGYWYDGACHKTPKAGATSMAPQVQVSTRAYTPPTGQQPAVDMNVIRQLTIEVQRLSQENAQLRTQMQSAQAASPTVLVEQILPGPVKQRQERYGFMADTQQPLVTRRTEQIRKRFDFMG